MFTKSEPKQQEITWEDNHFIGLGLVITVNQSFGCWEIELSNGHKTVSVSAFKKIEAFTWLNKKSLQELMNLLNKESKDWMRRMSVYGVSDIEMAIEILKPAVELENCAENTSSNQHI